MSGDHLSDEDADEDADDGDDAADGDADRLADPLASGDRYLLQERYLELTRELLPRAAERGAWRVRNDHCFMRVLLDHACGGCWYDHLDRRLKAYKQLNVERLRAAVTLGERMLREGEAVVEEHNRQSLRWRGKRVGVNDAPVP